MTDNEKLDTGVLDLEDLEHYVVLGVRKGTREAIVLASPKITAPEMGALLGRAQTNLNLQVAQAGMHAYVQHMQAHLKGSSPIIVPGMHRAKGQ